jgi:hypothetical protein
MSTETSSASKRPTHRVFAVTRRNPNDKGFWTDIGAAWAHADGKGFSLKLEYLPLNGGDIVVRTPEEKAPAQEGAAQ